MLLWFAFEPSWGFSFFTLVKVFWRRSLIGAEGYGHNDNMLSIGERLGYIGSFAILIANIFIIAYFLQFLSQSDEICHHLHQKILYVPFWQICQYLKLCLLPVFYCITIAVLHYLASQRQQCCSLCCINEILS